MSKNKGRIQGLQALRAIAFLEIFLGHCGVRFFTGAFGVSIFMVLSGFCMAVNYLPKADGIKASPMENGKFAWSKVKKLYGLQLVMLGVAYWFSKMPTSLEAQKKMLLDICLLQSLIPYSDVFFSYNGVAWYLSVYLFICFFAPWILKLFGKCREKKAVIFISVLIYGVMVALGYVVTRKSIAIGDYFAYWFTYIFPGYRLLDFTLGVTLGWMYLHLEKPSVGKWLMTFLEAGAAAAFVLVILIFHRMEGVYDGLCYTALFAPVSVLLVWIFACSQGWILRLWNNPLFCWIGHLSGGAFLIHQIPVRWLRIYFPRTMEEPWRVLCIILIGFVLSILGAEAVGLVRKIMQKNVKSRNQIDN